MRRADRSIHPPIETKPRPRHTKIGKRTAKELAAVKGDADDGAVPGAGQQRERVLGPGEVRHGGCRVMIDGVWAGMEGEGQWVVG